MRSLAATLQAFFSVRLLQERRASPNTVASYRDTFKLLLSFVHLRTGKPPAEQGFEDLEAPTVGAFLQHLETKRHNSVSTRNTRLAAIHSFFTYASYAELGIRGVMPSRKLCRVGRTAVPRPCSKRVIATVNYSA